MRSGSELEALLVWLFMAKSLASPKRQPDTEALLVLNSMLGQSHFQRRMGAFEVRSFSLFVNSQPLALMRASVVLARQELPERSCRSTLPLLVFTSMASMCMSWSFTLALEVSRRASVTPRRPAAVTPALLSVTRTVPE